MTEGETMNPFALPGMRDNPYQPLRPWKEPAHHDYYVRVDRTEEAYSEFKQRVDGPESLTHGRLVVVIGGQGCGKSSLVNRCAAWAHSVLRAGGITAEIIDLTMECEDNQSIRDRMTQVCSLITGELALGRRMSRGILSELKARQDSPELLYRYLSGVLNLAAGEGLALVVLLPPSHDLEEEIVRYAGLVHPRLVFFAESSYLEDRGDWRVKLERATRARPAPPIVLTVGMLQNDDCWRFAHDRLERHDEDRMIPRVSETTMSRVVQARRTAWTIEQLQRLLFGVYGEILQRSAPVTEVTFEDITEYYFSYGTGS
jgi:hypothetical protein